MTTTAVLLAAGRSLRFGSDDKLLAPLAGKYLIRHAADALLASPVDQLIAVTSSSMVAQCLPEFDVLHVPDVPAKLSSSLCFGTARAMQDAATTLLIVLGDMPFISSKHLSGLLNTAKEYGASATCADGVTGPPACFTAEYFPEILQAKEDTGARGLLSRLPNASRVQVSSKTVADIDTQADLLLAQCDISAPSLRRE